MRRWRKMTWALIAWTVLILAWAIAGGSSANCASETTQLNRDACAAGAGVGVALILLVGFFGFIFLTAIWFMTREKGRPCPRCGENVKRGVLTCEACGFDFYTMAPGQPPPAPSATPWESYDRERARQVEQRRV